jgi:tetratricopeptide (TPR) repeat protein
MTTKPGAELSSAAGGASPSAGWSNVADFGIARTTAASGGAGLKSRLASFAAGAASASVILLAFLIPSLQDQWDRWELRHAVDAYAGVGRGLASEGHYTAAEQAFDRALELAGTHRLDLLEEKLQARVARVNEDPEWLGTVPDELTESDFLYLLELQKDDPGGRRAATLSAYATLLAGQHRGPDAERRFGEALAADPNFAPAHVGLGNLLADRGNARRAEVHYRRAIVLAPDDANAHYDLGLLLAAGGRATDAAREFRIAAELAPQDVAMHVRLGEALAASGQTAAARVSLARAQALEPDNAEARAALRSLPALERAK